MGAAVQKKRAGIGSMVLGAFDWTCRFDAMRDFVARASTNNVATFVHDSSWWVAPALIVIGIVLLLWDRSGRLGLEEAEPSTSSSKAAVKDRANATATGGSATIGDINIYTHPPQPVATVSSPRPVSPSEVPLQINVRCISARVTNIDLDMDSRGEPIIREVNSSTGTMAAVASFRNVSTNGVNAENVTAHLRLYDSGGKELLTGISRLCWLDSSFDMTDINVEETGHVVLLVRKDRGLYIPWKRRSNTSAGDLLENGMVDAPTNLASMEITILSEWNRRLLPPRFVEVSLDNGLSVSLRPLT